MYVKGVGPARAAMLEGKGLKVVEDLLTYAPFRYEDRSNVKSLRDLAPGEMATVLAEVRSTKVSGFRQRNLGLFQATFTALTGYGLGVGLCTLSITIGKLRLADYAAMVTYLNLGLALVMVIIIAGVSSYFGIRRVLRIEPFEIFRG